MQYCISGYTCLPGEEDVEVCQSAITTTTTAFVLAFATSSYTNYKSKITVGVSPYTRAWAQPVNVKWKTEDLSLFPAEIAVSLGARLTPTMTVPPTSKGKPTPTTSFTHETTATINITGHGGLPKIELILITVLVPLGIIFLTIFASLHIRRRKRMLCAQASLNSGTSTGIHEPEMSRSSSDILPF